MPKIQGARKTAVKRAKTRVELRREAAERQREACITFTCTACPHTVTRVRNLRYHLCGVHNLWCNTLRQRESFPQPDSVLRVPTAEEYAVYGHGQHKKAPRATRRRQIVTTAATSDGISAVEDDGTSNDLGVLAVKTESRGECRKTSTGTKMPTPIISGFKFLIQF